MTPDHIEAARVFVETLASTKKHAHRTVVDMPPPDGDICTPAMLHDVLKFKWLNGAVSMSLVLTKLSFVLHNLIQFFVYVCRSSMHIVNTYNTVIFLIVTYQQRGSPNLC